MNRLQLVAAGALALAACSDSTTDPTLNPAVPGINASNGAGAQVTTSANSGDGSLRAAIDAASADPSITHIQVKKDLGTVTLEAPIHYSGAQQLTIHGGDLVLDASGLADGESGILADGGGNLTITNLSIEGSPGYGLRVEVPAGASGVQSLTLDRFAVRNNALHGVLMNDQETPLLSPFPEDGDVTDPADAQGGTAASLDVRVTNSTFEGNGFGALDNDRIRINEGGIGELVFTISGSLTTGNGADGIELDERGTGSVVFSVQQTSILENGFFDQRPPATRDLDDGIDVDEWGEGDLVGRFVQVRANDNAEQGVDLNENEAGNLRVTMANVEGSGNGQEGIEFEEDDDVPGGGNIDADLSGITTNDNGHFEDDEGALGDGGLKSREKGVGDNYTRVIGATSNANLGADGVIVREEGDGDIVTVLTNIVALNNPDNGIQVREANGGALDARITSATLSGNGNVGVRLRDNGTAILRSLNNTDGLQVAGGVTVDEKPVP